MDANTMKATLEHKHTNHLIDENSPYLLSHAHNPVNWYPWGEEALDRARSEDKPIFLSIGYSACHWCHVMERESFENEEIAAMLNQHFISIKVDREQRPDIDKIYMAFTTAMTGHGGWPMSVFLTPELKPYYAGTYFPPEDRYGRPGFKRLITELALAYDSQKEKVYSAATEIYNRINKEQSTNLSPVNLTQDLPRRAAVQFANQSDKEHGGIGREPKFPHAVELSLLLRQFKSTGDSTFLQTAELALTKMARGGIFDQLGGGFSRYSTDRKWLVPHFEKMLYDNSLLVSTYAEAFQLTGNELYREVVTKTLDFILRELSDSSGGFYSALDADSEGEEGKFYVWSSSEIEHLLGDEADLFMRYYNVTAAGNFEGKNILN
ncbi:MAG: thioredoxin domain-containing protein, partial [candidate division Zixibacteria bacterium]